jgi:hypothetical protein
MNARELQNLLNTDTEWLAYKAGRDRSTCTAFMQRARLHDADSNPTAVRICVEAAREAHHEYIRSATELRRKKDLEAQRREDNRNTLRQY